MLLCSQAIDYNKCTCTCNCWRSCLLVVLIHTYIYTILMLLCNQAIDYTGNCWRSYWSEELRRLHRQRWIQRFGFTTGFIRSESGGYSSLGCVDNSPFINYWWPLLTKVLPFNEKVSHDWLCMGYRQYGVSENLRSPIIIGLDFILAYGIYKLKGLDYWLCLHPQQRYEWSIVLAWRLVEAFVLWWSLFCHWIRYFYNNIQQSKSVYFIREQNVCEQFVQCRHRRKPAQHVYRYSNPMMVGLSIAYMHVCRIVCME